MQDVAERDELMRRHRAALDLRAHAVDPRHELDVEIGVAAEVVVDAAAAFDHAGQDVVDVADREGVVESVIVDRAFGSGARTVPRFAFGIAFAAEQDRLAVRAAGNQREHGFGFGEAGEVMEIAVLPVRIMAVVVAQPFRRGGHDADGIAAHDSHQLTAATRVLFAFDHGRSRESGMAEREIGRSERKCVLSSIPDSPFPIPA